MNLRRVAILALFLVACAGPAPEPYPYRAPPTAAAPVGLDPDTWTSHLRDDLLPYWTMDAAKGSPVGNFPTYRGMDGSAQPPATRKPRMMGRQIFFYSAAYLLTGDEGLLDLARAGNRWLLDHARDTARGGWHADLDAAGNPSGDGDKLAQDMAYDVMGPAAFFFVTRDAESEAAVLATRDLLFDPAKLWDAPNGRIKDGMNAPLTAEALMGSAGSWELVAQLDPITAFLLLVQPVLTEQARRDQVLGDLRTLAQLLGTRFWKDGIFWGSTGAIGRYGTNHTDYGHILKAYWAVLQVDKRLPDHPFHAFVEANAAVTLDKAYDAPWGRWAKLPITANVLRYGSDWWAAAESDQLAATLALGDPAWIAKLAETSGHFRSDFVDRTRPARELVPSVNRDGSWVYGWGNSDTAKCNEWKNAFHGAEHALVLALFAHWLEGTAAPLYFALPAGSTDSMAQASRPYTFLGRVAKVEDLGPLAGDASRHKVRISFDQLR